MIGTGSRPESAIRPANTETKDPGPSASQEAASSTWSRVINAVTFTLIPLAESRRTTSAVGSPRVVVIGTFT